MINVGKWLLIGLCVIWGGKLNALTETKITASDGSVGNGFGWSAKISGTTFVVGARKGDGMVADSGAAYIYTLNGASWNETKIYASDGGLDDDYGYSVAIDGTRIVVGAYRDDDNGNNSGAIYIYDFDGMSWNETKITASDGQDDDWFGAEVDISGDRVIAGAENAGNSGAAYIFEFNGTDWEETKLTPIEGGIGWYGISVAIHGDGAVVGDCYDHMMAGAAYFYHFNGTSWEETKITSSDGAEDDYFGGAVDIQGNTLLIGAPRSNAQGSNSGAMYIYEFDGFDWQETKILAGDGESSDNYGTFTAIYNGVLLTSTFLKSTGRGAAYVYENMYGNWHENIIIPSDSHTNMYFGYCLALNDQYAVIGAVRDNEDGYDSGSVYVYSDYAPEPDVPALSIMSLLVLLGSFSLVILTTRR